LGDLVDRVIVVRDNRRVDRPAFPALPGKPFMGRGKEQGISRSYPLTAGQVQDLFKQTLQNLAAPRSTF
jgi:hypothetical protein